MDNSKENKFDLWNMDKIKFPTQYKKAITSHKKRITIRVGDEIGLYKEGIYAAASYSGKTWDVKCYIHNIVKTTVSGLVLYGIPRMSIKSLVKKEGLKKQDAVEIIRFDY